MFTHFSFECINASLVNHSLDVNLDSLRIHSSFITYWSLGLSGLLYSFSAILADTVLTTFCPTKQAVEN